MEKKIRLNNKEYISVDKCSICECPIYEVRKYSIIYARADRFCSFHKEVFDLIIKGYETMYGSENWSKYSNSLASFIYDNIYVLTDKFIEHLPNYPRHYGKPTNYFDEEIKSKLLESK